MPVYVSVEWIDGAANVLIIECGKIGPVNARRVGIKDLAGHRPNVGAEMHGALEYDETTAGRVDARDSLLLGIETLAANRRDDDFHSADHKRRCWAEVIFNALHHPAAIDESTIAQGSDVRVAAHG